MDPLHPSPAILAVTARWGLPRWGLPRWGLPTAATRGQYIRPRLKAATRLTPPPGRRTPPATRGRSGRRTAGRLASRSGSAWAVPSRSPRRGTRRPERPRRDRAALPPDTSPFTRSRTWWNRSIRTVPALARRTSRPLAPCAARSRVRTRASTCRRWWTTGWRRRGWVAVYWRNEFATGPRREATIPRTKPCSGVCSTPW